MEAVRERPDFGIEVGGFEELLEAVSGGTELVDAECGARGFVEEEAGVNLFVFGECLSPAFGEVLWE
jgi:hypothetical protein